MYCVYQIDKNLDEKVFRLRCNKSDFITRLTDNICSEYNARTLVGISFNDIRSYVCFTEAYYLLINGIQFQLVTKHKKNKKGFFNDSTWFETDILFTWKLLPLEEENDEHLTNDIDQNMMEFQKSVNSEPDDTDKLVNEEKPLFDND